MDVSEYETIKETATRLGKSRERIAQLMRKDRIPGILKIGRNYLIPKSFVPENIDYRTVEGRGLKESKKMFENKSPNRD